MNTTDPFAQVRHLISGPTADELLVISECCSIDEWRRLCCLREFIDATQVSLARCVAVAELNLGRPLRPLVQKTKY